MIGIFDAKNLANDPCLKPRHQHGAERMNTLPANKEFTVIAGLPNEWLVLRCQSSRTLALAAALADYGAWTPTWRRKRRLPRSPISRVVTEACLPSFVFVPAPTAFGLPHVPIAFGFMLNADYTLIRVPDRQLEPMRKIADKPLVAASKLPRPGQRVRFSEGAWEGLRGKVLSCTIRQCRVLLDDPFSREITVPPMMLAVD